MEGQGNQIRALNFGSLNLDYVYSVDHMVRPKETLACTDMQVFCGGKGLNQSIALAKAGAAVYHAGLIGEEGDGLLLECAKAGVHTEYIRTISGKCGHTIIQVDRDGQNCILLYGGANRRMTKEYIDEVLRDFKEKDILLLQNEVNLVPYMIERAYEKGMTVVLNPSPYDKEMDGSDFQKAFQKVSMFILNEVEGEQMTGEAQPEKILLKMKSLYPESITVLTLGEKGSIYQYKDERHQQRIYPVKAVDTTAAGDTFTGYFLSSVMEGMPAPEGLALAAKASAIAVSKSGAAASIPLRDEVERF